MTHGPGGRQWNRHSVCCQSTGRTESFRPMWVSCRTMTFPSVSGRALNTQICIG